LGDFNGVGTPRSYQAGINKKIRQYGFFDFIESAKASLILKCLELKFRLAFVLQNCVALVFKEMDHCL
jgi:hypothetical protein